MARVASTAECRWAVTEAERHARWYTCMPGEYPTNDVVIAECPALRSWLNDKLRSSIWPLLAAQFGMTPGDFCLGLGLGLRLGLGLGARLGLGLGAGLRFGLA